MPTSAKKKAKSEKAAPAKVAKAAKSLAKVDVKSSKIDKKQLEAQAAPVSDEDEDDMAPAGGGGGGSPSMGDLAMGEIEGKPGEATASSLKNFRHHPDIENFYRFIYENDLRYEALGIIDQFLIDKQNRKKSKQSKLHVH